VPPTKHKTSMIVTRLPDEPRKTPTQLKDENDKLKRQLAEMKDKAYCYMCDEHKGRTGFYASSDPNVKSGLSRICKKCAYNIACPLDAEGNNQEPTKATVMMALEYLDKPFIQKIWDSAYYEFMNTDSSRPKANIWVAYIRNVSMPNYVHMRWKDGDIFKTHMNMGKLDAALPSDIESQVLEHEKTVQEEIFETYERNKRDAIRLTGYDPFEFEAEEDKPLLYSKLIRMCDASEDANDDEIKLSSIIEIIQSFNQLGKINRQISLYQNDVSSLPTNLTAYKSLQEIKKNTVSSINSLAKESCLSLKNSNTNTKGTNTWTGKVKELKERNLREAENNLYDIETCAGMQQVAEISDAAILKQIMLDENDYTEMLREQRTIITKLRQQKKDAEERVRLLIRENYDLKDLLVENGIDISAHSVPSPLLSSIDELGDDDE